VRVRKFVVFGMTLALALGAFVLVGCGSPQEPAAETPATPEAPELTGSVTIQGSDTMLNIGTAWSEAFMDANPGVDVQVQGGGSGTGIAALINGTV
jgi:phosphate transport system substrate-binding protein